MNTTLTLAALTTLLASASAFSAVVLTGDPTTTTGAGLVHIGSSQDAALKSDEAGAGFVYDIYLGRYTVSAADIVSADFGNTLKGNTAEGAAGGSFNVGDDIYVIGWKAGVQNVGGTGDAQHNGYIKVDPNGNGGYTTAAQAAPGSPSTSFSTNADAGDFQLETSRNAFNEFRVVNFRMYTTSSNTYPMQSGGVNTAFDNAANDLPFRTLGVDISGTSGLSSERLTSQLILLNVTDFNAASFGGTDVNDIGATLRFYMQQGNIEGSTGVVVPEPASLGLLALGGMLLGRRRRV